MGCGFYEPSQILIFSQPLEHFNSVGDFLVDGPERNTEVYTPNPHRVGGAQARCGSEGSSGVALWAGSRFIGPFTVLDGL